MYHPFKMLKQKIHQAHTHTVRLQNPVVCDPLAVELKSVSVVKRKIC